MLINNEDSQDQGYASDGLAAERQYSIAIFGQTGEEIGEWLRCTGIREQPGRVTFIDDHNHEVILRGGIIVIQEQ